MSDPQDTRQVLNCYFCGAETQEFCVGCDESVCANCDVVGEVMKEHSPDIHLGDDEDADVELDVDLGGDSAGELA